MTASQTTNGGQPYAFQYTHNLADAIKTMQMPSGRVITTTYDNAGRPTAVSGGGPTPYATIASYGPHGAPEQITLGNTLTEKRCFNTRMEIVVLRQRPTASPKDCSTGGMTTDASDVGYLQYSYANSGNVTGQAIQYGASGSYGAKSFQQTYTYDAANRLLSASEAGPGAAWAQGFGYDKVGNRWVSSGVHPDPFTPLASGAFNSSNRMTGSSAQYDGAGNQTAIGGSYQFGYDAENRLKSSTFGTTAAYTYDADGRRVMKVSGGVTTVFVYDVTGQLAAEYTLTGAAPASPCTTCYLMADHLGSTRLQTDGSGQQKVLYDYLPFGESLVNGDDGRDARWGGAGGGMRFTGKEQEGAEGAYQQYFGARYFSGGQGRFTSPDEPFIDQDVDDPQSWNLHSYVRNNPLRFTDPSGQACVSNDNGGWKDDDSGGQSCADVDKANREKKPDQTVTGNPEPITWRQYFGFDRAYKRAIGQQIQIDFNAKRWDNIPVLRGEMPLGPPGGAGRFLFQNWNRATFANRLQSLLYHWRKHGMARGKTFEQYAQDAVAFFNQNKSIATQVTLKDGTPGLLIRLGKGQPGGYFKPTGEVVTFWYK